MGDVVIAVVIAFQLSICIDMQKGCKVVQGMDENGQATTVCECV